MGAFQDYAFRVPTRAREGLCLFQESRSLTHLTACSGKARAGFQRRDVRLAYGQRTGQRRGGFDIACVQIGVEQAD